MNFVSSLCVLGVKDFVLSLNIDDDNDKSYEVLKKT